MRNPSANDLRDASVLIALLGILFFGPPLIDWWVSEDNPWYLPYLLWLIIILLAGLIHLRHARHGL